MHAIRTASSPCGRPDLGQDIDRLPMRRVAEKAERNAIAFRRHFYEQSCYATSADYIPVEKTASNVHRVARGGFGPWPPASDWW